MRRPRYESYEASGVEWLGEIPAHWRIERLKYSATTNDETLAESADPGLEIHYVDIGSVDPILGITKTESMFFEDAPSRARRIVRSGDTIVSTVRTYLRAIAPITNPAENTIASTGFAVIRPNTVEARYLSFALREPGFVEAIVARSVGVSYPAVNATEIGGLPIPLPPPEEQTAIAGFLDRETAKIDDLIAKKRTLIERLQEKRTALISRTVTRGLPPAAARAAGLDPNPKLKPSGIDWLGEVPAHWMVGKFTREVRIAEGQVDPGVDPYASMILVAPNHIESGTGRLLGEETAADQAAISGKYLCRAGDVIYSKIRPALAKACLAPSDCLCSADMYPMTPLGALTADFLLLVLLSSQFTAWSVLEADRVAMPKINRETLSDLRLPVPPPAEQVAICNFVGIHASDIDMMLARCTTAVERLQEYRTALITAAVTGKVDVRGPAS